MPPFSHVLMTLGLLAYMCLAIWAVAKGIFTRDPIALISFGIYVGLGSVFATELHYMSGFLKACLLWTLLVLAVFLSAGEYHHTSQRGP